MSDTPALRVFKPGETIIREGDPGDVAYLVIRGKAQAYRGSGANEVVLQDIGPTQIFGEFALVTDSPRASNVRAVEQTECLIVTRAILRAAIDRSEPLVRAIINDYIRRLRG
jgi:putative ABC transport system ATP-binding protein